MSAKLKKGDKIPFTQISNAVAYSANISFKAKGIYLYMCAKPNNWQFNARRIADEVKDGRDSVLNGLKELKEIGLIEYHKSKDGRSHYTIYCDIQKPKTDNPTLGADPKTDNPTLENPTVGKPDPYITKNPTNKEVLKNSLKNHNLEQEHSKIGTTESKLDKMLRQKQLELGIKVTQLVKGKRV